MQTDKAGAVKVSQKITTLYSQLIFHEIFTEDNTEQSQIDVKWRDAML